MLVICTTARALGWSARGKRREGAGTRAGGGRGHPHASETRARGRGRVVPRGRSARAAAKNAPSRSLLQDALPATPCSPPERGLQGKVDRRNHRAAGLTILDGSREDTARRGMRRGGSRRHERGREPRRGARSATLTHPSRVQKETREWFENRETPIVRRSRRENDDVGTRAYLRGSLGREMHGPGRFVRCGMGARAAQANRLKRTIFVSFLPRVAKSAIEAIRALGRKPISWFPTRRHLNIALPNADVAFFLL